MIRGGDGTPQKDAEVIPHDEAEVKLRHASDIALLRTFAALTHRLHVADRERTAAAPLIRGQRDRVEAEILSRMRRD